MFINRSKYPGPSLLLQWTRLVHSSGGDSMARGIAESDVQLARQPPNNPDGSCNRHTNEARNAVVLHLLDAPTSIRQVIGNERRSFSNPRQLHRRGTHNPRAQT